MDTTDNDQWARYGRALIASMNEVLDETPEDMHANLLETADYWLSLGLLLGLKDREPARRLLEVIEAQQAERGELERDAQTLIRDVFSDGPPSSR